MSSSIVYLQGQSIQLTIPATYSIAVASNNDTQVYQIVGYPNHPSVKSSIGTVTLSGGPVIYGPYASGATIQIEAGAAAVRYEIGLNPVVQAVLDSQPQITPLALDATGALTGLMILGGIVTSSTAAAVAGTVPTGTVMDTQSQFTVNDSIDWSVIATGGNAFTVTAAAGHTLVGSGVVATVTSGRFRTRKTAANTFVTYRLA